MSQNYLQQKLKIASPHLTRNKITSFLHRIITGDEKWVMYVNVKNSKQWLLKVETPMQVVKYGLNNKKVMLCIW